MTLSPFFPTRSIYHKETECTSANVYLQTKLKKVSNKHNLRSMENTMLNVPHSKLEFFRKSLDYSGP